MKYEYRHYKKLSPSDDYKPGDIVFVDSENRFRTIFVVENNKIQFLDIPGVWFSPSGMRLYYALV